MIKSTQPRIINWKYKKHGPTYLFILGFLLVKQMWQGWWLCSFLIGLNGKVYKRDSWWNFYDLFTVLTSRSLKVSLEVLTLIMVFFECLTEMFWQFWNISSISLSNIVFERIIKWKMISNDALWKELSLNFKKWSLLIDFLHCISSIQWETHKNNLWVNGWVTLTGEDNKKKGVWIY